MPVTSLCKMMKFQKDLINLFKLDTIQFTIHKVAICQLHCILPLNICKFLFLSCKCRFSGWGTVNSLDLELKTLPWHLIMARIDCSFYKTKNVVSIITLHKVPSLLKRFPFFNTSEINIILMYCILPKGFISLLWLLKFITTKCMYSGTQLAQTSKYQKAGQKLLKNGPKRITGT